MRKFLIGLGLLCGVSSSAFAVTECAAKITQVYVGDGSVWIVTDASPTGVVYQSNADSKNIYAAALTALNADKGVTLRFSADGVPCASSQGARGDLVGLWIRK